MDVFYAYRFGQPKLGSASQFMIWCSEEILYEDKDRHADYMCLYKQQY